MAHQGLRWDGDQHGPHNLGEIIDGIVYLLDNPEAAIKDLMKFVKGPDFPTAGIISGREGFVDAYK